MYNIHILNFGITASSVGDMDSMFDEEASSDDETVNSDVRTIRKQLEGLETMYSEVCNRYLFSTTFVSF